MGYCFELTLFQLNAVFLYQNNDRFNQIYVRIPLFISNRLKKDDFDSLTPITLSLMGIVANMCLILKALVAGPLKLFLRLPLQTMISLYII